jgi:HTH-type transcriptional regulator/antitoxin HigA
MSINIKQLTPASAIHPGEILKDELKERGITQKEFAQLTGIPQTQLNEIIKGKRGINADVALVIGKSLQMDAAVWLSLQSNYELDEAKVNKKNIERIAALDLWQMVKSYVPEKYFKKQGIVTGNPVQDIPIVKSIYRVQNFDQLAAVYSHATYSKFRKSEKLSIDKINLVGWTKLVHYLADQKVVKDFDVRKEEELVKALNEVFRKNKNTIEKTVQVLAEYGIKLIVQPHPEKCAVDGISFWSNGNPAIGISIRHKRIDNFAFTIMHELGHVFKHLINNNTAEFIDLDKEHNVPEYKNSKEEKEANEFASNSLIVNDEWKRFKSSNPSFNKVAIVEFAKTNKINPAIVQGRYCFEMEFYGIKSSIDKTLY